MTLLSLLHKRPAGGGGPTYLKYRTFDGVDDIVVSSFGDLAGDATGSLSVAWCGRINSLAADAELLSTSTYEPLDFYINGGSDIIAVYDGASNANGPSLSTSHGFVIIVYAKNTSAAVDWSYYRFDTNTWSHTTPGDSHTRTTAFGSAPGTLNHGSGSGTPCSGDLVASAVWTGTKLNTTQRATLSTSWAAWTALSPTEAWRYDQSSPGTSVVGTATQSSITGTTLSGSDSPLPVS